jgi:DNA-binding NtrC family response regulator
VGGEQTLKVEVRVLAATNQDLSAAVAAGRFREDLYFRLAVVPLKAPPLRERSEDIPLLCQAFVEQCAQENGLKQKPIAPEALAVLSGFEWPGNVRELRNVIERLVILSEDRIGVGDLPEEIVTEFSRRNRPERAVAALDLPPETRTLPLRELRDLVERQYILSKLDENGWNISRTAQVLDIERTNLHKKMRALGISRDDRREPGDG